MVPMFFRLLRSLFLFVLLIVVALIGFAFVVIEDTPSVAAYQPPSAEDVVAARSFVGEVQAALNPDVAQSQVISSEAELNSVIKLGARLIPGFRGHVEVDGQVVTGLVSVPLPYLTGKWVNAHASVPAFDGQLAFSEVRIGPVGLPPKATLSLIRFAAGQVLGGETGDKLIDAAQKMQIAGTQLTFDMAIDHMGEMGSNGIMRGLFGALRGGDLPPLEEIGQYYALIRTAMDRGELPTTGSYLPYLQFTLEAAHQNATPDTQQDAYTAAIFALTLVCGARDFQTVVGGLSDAISDVDRDWQTDCRKVTFNDRIDSRRHFTTAAAIQAASNRGVAITIGEFKELYDSQRSGGFDFTDIAANNSGIRLSNRFMGAAGNDWPALLARIQTEGDVLVSYDGIPQIMSAEDFEQSYGHVDDPRYHVMLDKIEAKIDELTLHQK